MWDDNLFDEMERRMNRIIRDFSDYTEKKRIPEGYRKALTEFKENDNEIVLEIELPGIEKEDINLDVTDNEIIIKAENKKEKEHKDEKNKKYAYAKSYIGFYRNIALPENADSENVDAVYENGILTIKINKKKINIKRKEVKIN